MVLAAAFVTWQDSRSGTSCDIYGQHISATGAPLWTTNGYSFCSATNDQQFPKMAPDGAGGGIVAWMDVRGATGHDIYAQRVSAAGATPWTTNGVPIRQASFDQLNPVIVSDGAGSAITAWVDLRDGGTNIDAGRITAGGVLP